MKFNTSPIKAEKVTIQQSSFNSYANDTGSKTLISQRLLKLTRKTRFYSIISKSQNSNRTELTLNHYYFCKEKKKQATIKMI